MAETSKCNSPLSEKVTQSVPGQLSRVTKPQVTCAHPVVSSPAEKSIGVFSGTGQNTRVQLTSAIPQTVAENATARRGRKPKQKPLKSPPSIVQQAFPEQRVPVDIQQGRNSQEFQQRTESAHTVARMQHSSVSSVAQQSQSPGVQGSQSGDNNGLEVLNVQLDRAPDLVQQLLEISQAAGDGNVTTLTLSQEQSKEIFGKLNTCAMAPGATDTALPPAVNISFIPTEAPGGGKVETAPSAPSVAEALLDQMYAPSADDCAPSSNGTKATSDVTDKPLGGIEVVNTVPESDVRRRNNSSPSYVSPDILQLLSQANNAHGRKQ